MVSKVLHRTHLYLALFLMPWMLMYALSTMAMNHRETFKAYYGGRLVEYRKVEEQIYTGMFAEGAGSRIVAEQILNDLDLDGTHTVRGRLDRGRITILRQDPITPKRITYTTKDRRVVVEEQIFRPPSFLESLHRRRGYGHEYVLEDVWAFSVDLVILAMVFWAVSGIWMWWEVRSTRGLGALCAGVGVLLFLFFVLTL